MIGEISNVELQAKYTSNNDKLHMAYSFDLLREEFSPKHIKNTVSKFYKETSGVWPTWIFSNHDVKRHLSRWNKLKKNNKKFARLTCALLMSLKGTPCIYQGEELGQTQTKIEFHEITDPPGKKFWPMDFGRDGCRTPLTWDENKKFAGFSKSKPWLPIKKEQVMNSAKMQLENRNSIYHFYKKFIFQRKKIPYFYEEITFSRNEKVLIFFRGNKKELCCIFNLSEKEIAFKNLNAKEFANQGFPNKKDENWKFSDLNQIIKKEIGELKFYHEDSEKNDVSKDLFLDQIKHNKLFFVNGQLEQIDFSYEDKTKIEFLENQNDIDEKSVENSLINLNNALVDKSFKLLIKKNYQIQNPLVIYHTTNNKLNSQNINFKIRY